jgi:hypothetical protein
VCWWHLRFGLGLELLLLGIVFLIQSKRLEWVPSVVQKSPPYTME